MEWYTVGALVIGSAGIGGTINARFERRHAEAQAKLEREHAAALARAERTYTRRHKAYIGAARMLERMRVNVTRVYPVLTIGEPLPQVESTDEEWERIIAPLVVAMSEAAADAILEVQARLAGFRGAVWAWEAAKADPSGQGRAAARRDLDGSRKPVLDAIDNAERLMRSELDAL